MLHFLAIIGIGWMIYEFCSWIGRGFTPKVDNHSTFYDYGDTPVIAGVTFKRYGSGYIDLTDTYIYAKNLNNVDYYWIAPSINITKEQFLEGINANTTIGTMNRTVSRKRAKA